MDDISLFADRFDSTGLGGSHRAAVEFIAVGGGNGILLNGGWGGLEPLVYTNVCGLGLIQKPFASANAIK
jgi:hypothetical protein